MASGYYDDDEVVLLLPEPLPEHVIILHPSPSLVVISTDTPSIMSPMICTTVARCRLDDAPSGAHLIFDTPGAWAK